jgi:hypothetical protein
MKDGREPKRLVGGPEPATPEERWLRRAFTEAESLTAPSERALPARVRQRPRRLTRPWLQLALAIAVVMIAGATLAAFQRFVRPHLAAGRGAPPAAGEHAHRRRTAEAAAPTPEAPAATPEPSPSPPELAAPPIAPAAPPAAPPAEPRHRAAIRPTMDAPAAAVLPLGRPRWPTEAGHAAPRPTAESPGEPPSEARLLARALTHLRAAHDARAALDDLAERDRLFPNGLLIPEALRLRTEALLDLGREHDALAALGGAERSELTPALALIRGELRAREGRCPDALEDLAPLAADESTPRALAERALYARAACHAQLRDVAAARAELERYQARFPSGAFHDEAAAYLRATAP